MSAISSPAERLEDQLARFEAKIDRFRGDIQDLRNVVEESGLKLPITEWISTTQLGERIGVTNRTICKWIEEKKFPSTCVKKQKRGDGFVYRLRSAQAIKAANELIVADKK